MVDVASWIAGLMRENYDAVGFIPEPTVDRQYVSHGRYVLQEDEAGKRVGYLLHSAPAYGHPLTISQHCIQYERRRNGYGAGALTELISRAEYVGASCVTARVGTDLDALDFWMAQGFRLINVVPGGQKRQRQIARLWLPLALPLIDIEPLRPVCPIGAAQEEVQQQQRHGESGRGNGIDPTNGTDRLPLSATRPSTDDNEPDCL